MKVVHLISAAFAWFKELFIRDKHQSDILKILIANSTDDDLNAIKDKDLGRAALDIVKDLNKIDTMSGKEKAELFNKLIAEFIFKTGKTIAKSAINLLRELAVTAVKVAATAAVAALLTDSNKQLADKSSEAKS